MALWKDSETVVDYLNFDYIIDAVVNIVLDEELSPSSIGLYGDWGSGKSSLMKMVETRLNEENDNTIMCIKFNGWLFEGYEDAKTALCGTILEKMHDNKKLSAKAKEKIKTLWDKVDVQKILGKGIHLGLDYLLTGGLISLTEFSISQIVQAVKKKVSGVSDEDIAEVLRSFKTETSVRKDIKDFQKDFSEILKESKINHLVVFVDELDRCTPETILDIIEAMRLFLFAKGTSFVIGADQRLIEYAIKTRYKDVIGNNLDIGREYMEKVIQYPVMIPALDENEVEQYISCLLLEKELEKEDFNKVLRIIRDLKPLEKFDYNLLSSKDEKLAEKCTDSLHLSVQISSVLARQINGNPRQCKRFLNMLFMRIQMAKSRKVDLDKNVMAKLMLIEYFSRRFYELVVNPENKEKFAIFEETGSEPTIFKDYSSDDWIQDWNKTSCKLATIDLKEYYYFSNSRLTYNHSAAAFLTPKGRVCLDMLVSKSDFKRTEAGKLIVNLSIGDRKYIAQSLYEQMKKDDIIDVELFKSYLVVVVSKDMVTDTIQQLKSIPARCFTKAHFIQLHNFLNLLSPEEMEAMKEHFGNNLVSENEMIKNLQRKLK